MRSQAELAEDEVEEASPLAVIGLLEVEDHRNVGADVDLLDDGSGSGREGGVTGGVRGSRVTGRGHCFGSRGATG